MRATILALALGGASASSSYAPFMGYNCYNRNGASDLETPTGSSAGAMTVQLHTGGAAASGSSSPLLF